MTTGDSAAAIIGVGATEFSKNSGRSELRLAVEAITAALADARVEAGEVGGLVTFILDNNDEVAVARSLGIDRGVFLARPPYGGGSGCAAIGLAEMAVRSGRTDIVVCYRAMNERSQQRFGSPEFYARMAGAGGVATSKQLDSSWANPFGMVTPAAAMAMSARRYMHEHGASSEDFGRVAVSARKYASTNPSASFYGRPITLDDHQNSRMVSDPLRLFDCCQESDGGVAFVVASGKRAKSAPHPVRITAAAQGFSGPQLGVGSFYHRDTAASEETEVVGASLWRQSGLTAADMDLAILYDHFTPGVLMQLEALGVCRRGEGPQFVRDEGIDLDGRLPVNTNGGQLGEAYIHGFNGIAEAVRQLRGRAVHQVEGARHVVVTSGSHVPTSGLVLSSS